MAESLIQDVNGEIIGLTPKQHIRGLNDEEFLAHLMVESPYGPMGVIFVLEAIRYYAEQVSLQKPPADDPTAIINPSAWHATAVSIIEKFNLRHEA
jgi:hypothetical protein